MKFNCGKSKAEKVNESFERATKESLELREWHKVFAIFPIRVGSRDCRWLEYVERRYEYTRVRRSLNEFYYCNREDVQYRAIDKETN